MSSIASIAPTMTIIEDVWPNLPLLHAYLMVAKDIAISDICPIYRERDGQKQIYSFRIQLEGSEPRLGYFSELLARANLKVV